MANGKTGIGERAIQGREGERNGGEMEESGREREQERGIERGGEREVRMVEGVEISTLFELYLSNPSAL